MILRKAQKRDVDGCFKLAKQEEEGYWEKNDFYNSLKNKDVGFYVAEENGKIVGFCKGFITPTRRKEALMHETRVDKKYRGKRIGTKLVNAVCDSFFNRGIKIIYALITPKLRPFYIKSCKFKETAKWIEISKKA